jgi:uncharacterized protein YcbK (DUF882 family)
MQDNNLIPGRCRYFRRKGATKYWIMPENRLDGMMAQSQAKNAVRSVSAYRQAWRNSLQRARGVEHFPEQSLHTEGFSVSIGSDAFKRDRNPKARTGTLPGNDLD